MLSASIGLAAELQTIVTLHKQLDSETTAEWDGVYCTAVLRHTGNKWCVRAEALLVLHWLHRVKPFRYIGKTKPGCNLCGSIECSVCQLGSYLKNQLETAILWMNPEGGYIRLLLSLIF